jgi:hypothetical protein
MSSIVWIAAISCFATRVLPGLGPMTFGVTSDPNAKSVIAKMTASTGIE